jgi:hypothetical protein
MTMNCVKCGREIDEDQVFCELCLNEMETYPVKPGTAIHIPARQPVEEVKKHRTKRSALLSPSEQVLKLKKKVRRLRITVIVLLLLSGALCFLVGRAAEELDFQRLLGQNYHTEEFVDAP